MRPGSVTAMPSAMVVPPGGLDRLAERAGHRRRSAPICTPTISMSGRSALTATAMPGDEAAATDRHDEHFEVGSRREHLQRDRALAGDDRGVVVRRDERGARARRRSRGPRRSPRRGSPRGGRRGRRESRVRVIFVNGVTPGMTIVASIPRQPRVVRDALGVVARGGGDHALRPLRRVEPRAGSCARPRSLNDAVYCRFSNLRTISAPVISESVRDDRAGRLDDGVRGYGPRPRRHRQQRPGDTTSPDYHTPPPWLPAHPLR